MLVLPTMVEHYEATVAGRRRHAILLRATTEVPLANDRITICEINAGQRTGRQCVARVTHVDTLTNGPTGPVRVLSIEVLPQGE